MPKVFRFFLCWIKSEVYVINIDTPDELLARILDADGRIKKQTNNTRSSHTSCTVHWGWRWDLRTFIVIC